MKNIFFGTLTAFFIFGGIFLFIIDITCGGCNGSPMFDTRVSNGLMSLAASFAGGIISLKGLSGIIR